MHAYLLTMSGPNAGGYYGTLAEAHNEAKDNLKIHPEYRGECRIELVDIKTDKPAVLRILNDQGAFQSEPIRTWAIAPRGGLKEVPNGE